MRWLSPIVVLIAAHRATPSSMDRHSHRRSSAEETAKAIASHHLLVRRAPPHPALPVPRTQPSASALTPSAVIRFAIALPRENAAVAQQPSRQRRYSDAVAHTLQIAPADVVVANVTWLHAVTHGGRGGAADYFASSSSRGRRRLLRAFFGGGGTFSSQEPGMGEGDDNGWAEQRAGATFGTGGGGALAAGAVGVQVVFNVLTGRVAVTKRLLVHMESPRFAAALGHHLEAVLRSSHPVGDATGFTVAAAPMLNQLDAVRTRALVGRWVADKLARRRTSGQNTVVILFDAAFVVILVLMLVFVAHQVLSDDDYGYPDDGDNKAMRRMHSLTNTLGLQPLHRTAVQHGGGGAAEETRGLLHPDRDSILPAVSEASESGPESGGDTNGDSSDVGSECADNGVHDDDITHPGKQPQGTVDVVV